MTKDRAQDRDGDCDSDTVCDGDQSKDQDRDGAVSPGKSGDANGHS